MLKIRITYNYERPEELEEAYKSRGKSKYSSIYLDVEIKVAHTKMSDPGSYNYVITNRSK